MNTFAIIGAGFSGTVAAIEFLNRMSGNAQLIIINRSGAAARGLAYGTNSPQHLLNVPVGNMTALVDHPDSFLEYCKKSEPEIAANSFVARKVYGDYLESLLKTAIAQASPRIQITQIISEVVSLKPSKEGAAIKLLDGQTLHADQVALAFGHFPPNHPFEFEETIHSHFLQNDPWQSHPQSESDKNGSILLIGGGLTAVDVITNLLKSAHTGSIYMLSRRGLLPKAHRVSRSGSGASTQIIELLLNSKPCVRSYLRIIRNEVQHRSTQGLDWRDVIASMRPITSELWKRLPGSERRKFLRHAQSYWDAHRHRVAPETYALFESALSTNQIIPITGRIKAAKVDNGLVRVDIKPKGKHTNQTVVVNLIVNCTGPSSNLKKINNQLIDQLLKDDLIAADTLGLGLHVDKRLFVKNNSGISSSWLSYVGPMLKADNWELTAVPELREAARSLAIKVCDIFEAKNKCN